MALALALALLAPASLAVAVGRGLIEGPALDLRLGSYHLVARSTEHPACLPLPQQCFIPRPPFQLPQPRYYTVWAGRISYPPVRGKPSRFATVEGRRLLQVQLRRD